MTRPETPDNNSVPGLTQAEALLRLQAEGANELPSAGQRQLWGIVLDVLREPMFLLLVSAGAIYLLLDDVNDALMLLGFVCIVMGITIYQEYKTERVLDALRDLTSPRALTCSTIVIGNLGLILVNRSWQHTLLTTLRSSNRAPWWVLGGAFSCLILALTLPFLRTAFHFASVTLFQFTLCVMIGTVSVLWFEWFKIIQRK